jgi:hypothetical protein
MTIQALQANLQDRTVLFAVLEVCVEVHRDIIASADVVTLADSILDRLSSFAAHSIDGHQSVGTR